MTKVRISKLDAIFNGKDAYVFDRVDDYIIQLSLMSDSSQNLSLSHAELLQLLEQPAVTIKYGYFGDAAAKRRAQAGNEIFSLLPSAERSTVRFKQVLCEIAQAAKALGEFSLTDVSYTAFRPILTRRTHEKLREILNSEVNSDLDPKELLKNAPCLKTLRKWLKEASTNDPLDLVKKSRFSSCNARNISAECEAIVVDTMRDYLRLGGIEIPELIRQINEEVQRRNRNALVTGAAQLRKVSESTIRRRVGELPKFEVLASREGIAAAKQEYGSHMGGIEAQVPGERGEMDEWEMDLIALLVKAGVDVTQQSLRDIGKKRYWLYAIIDCSTRCVLAIKLAENPNLDDALATVWMAMQNRNELARSLGCKSNWDQYCHISELVVDNGPVLVSSDFKAALSEIGVGYAVAPAGVPKLRGRIERLFLTFGKMLMQHLTGRTFSNPQVRGDYPTERYTVHTAESIVMVFTRFVVDVYHNTQHSRLMRATPANEWKRRVAKYGWTAPQGQHELRHAFGLKDTRALGRHGITFCKLNYHSEFLVNYLKRNGSEQLHIRVDPFDLGYVSCWVEGAWHTVPAIDRFAKGLSIPEWEQAVLKIHRFNDAKAEVSRDILEAAIASIKGLDAHQRAIMQVGPAVVTAAEIQRAEEEVFWGLKFTDTYEVSAARHPEKGGFMNPNSKGFLSNTVNASPKHPTVSASGTQGGQETSMRVDTVFGEAEINDFEDDDDWDFYDNDK